MSKIIFWSKTKLYSYQIKNVGRPLMLGEQQPVRTIVRRIVNRSSDIISLFIIIQWKYLQRRTYYYNIII